MYVEIAKDLSIRIEAIESIKKKNDLTSIVRTQSNSYDSTLPYPVLLQLLEREGTQESKGIEQKGFNIMKELGVTSP